MFARWAVPVHGGIVLTQSLAICEYLEECFPQTPLLPGSAGRRALVRSLALHIACEIHPLNNLRVQRHLQGAQPQKAIVIPGRLVNLVV